MLVGCNVISVNSPKYYSQVVITVDNVEYTKKDLIDAFYTYVYSQVQSGSMDAKKGVQTAAETLVERGLLVKEIKKTISLEDRDYKDIRKSAFESMQNQLDQLETTIMEERKIELPVSDSETEQTEEALRDAFVEYTPSIIYQGGHAIKNPAADEKDTTIDQLDIPMHFEQQINDPEISREAWTRYVSSLQSAAKAEGRSTKEADVVVAEEKRLIKLYEDIKYIEKYEEAFVNSEKYDDGDILKDSVCQSVLEYYQSLYRTQKGLYDGNLTKYYADMKEDSESVVYHPVEGKYMQVSHILLNFDTKQKADVAKLKKEKESTDMSDDEYQIRLNEIASRTMVTYEENGEKLQATAQTVYKRIYNYVTAVADPVKRAQRFNDMIYKYNDDPGIMNKEFSYVVDLDDAMYSDDIENPTNIMVREFTLDARSLYDANDTVDYGAGNISNALVVTDYGCHIILNTGAVRNITNNINTLTYESLFETYTQLNGYKDLFNYYYDEINSSKYDTTVEEQVAGLVARADVHYYENRYKDLWK